MLIIEVVSDPQTKTVEAKGNTFEIEYQHADLWVDGGRPRPLEIVKPRNGQHPKGLYTLAGSSFDTNRFNRLEMQYANLVPLAKALKIGETAIREYPKKAKPAA